MPDHTALRKDLVTLLPRLRRYAVSLTGNAADADDLVQDACLRVIGSADRWDAAMGLDRWAFRILRNLWFSETRKRSVRIGSGHVDAAESPELRDAATGEDALAARQLLGRLAALPEGFAEVLLLVAVEGYSYGEAAEHLGIPQGTVMSRIYRARRLLADQISQPGEAAG